MHPPGLRCPPAALARRTRDASLAPMKADASPPTDRILRAILSIIFSVLCFSVLNAMSKTLSQTYPVIEVIWGRYVFAFIFMMAIFLPRAGWRSSAGTTCRARSCAACCCSSRRSSISTASSTCRWPRRPRSRSTSPLIVTALSSKFLGEPVGPKRWAAVAIGFVGALIVVRPGSAHFEWHSLWIVGSTISQLALPALLAALRPGRAARRLGDHGDHRRHRGGPADAAVRMGDADLGWHWVLFVGMGIMAGVGHYFLTIAYSQAPAAVVAPFNYVQLLGAAALGYLVFGDFPDFWTWVGAGVIICSGLYLGHIERQRHKALIKK